MILWQKNQERVGAARVVLGLRAVGGSMWRRWRRGREGVGLAGVGFHASGLSFVRVERPPRAPAQVVAAEFRPFAGMPLEKVLAQLVLDHDLKRVACTTILGEGEYRLLQTEAPDVKPEELKAALRWRIKDLIEFHVNDVTIDVFDAPPQSPGRASLVYVVVGRNDAIRGRVDRMHEAGAALEVIDIPELAQRNLALLWPQDREGLALLTVSEDVGNITITREGTLFLSRTITGAQAAVRDAHGFERLLLELQRSLDYFESSFRQNPIMNIVVAPASPAIAPFITFLQANLAQRVVPWVVGDRGDLGIRIPVPDMCLMTLGAALREERVAL